MESPDKKDSAWTKAFIVESEPESGPQTSPLPPPSFKKPIFPPKPAKYRSMATGDEEFEIVGTPVFNVKWDDLGIGLMPQMGFMPNRAIRIVVKDRKWTITGARTSSATLLFLVLGAGGAFYFFENMLSSIKNWGEIAGALVVLLPTILNMVVRIRTLELYPFELDFLGYDPSSQVLVLSTVTDPAGVLAMKVELPTNEIVLKAEEAKLIASLRRSHTGFMLVDGSAGRTEESSIKRWSLWAFVWAILYGIVVWMYFNNR
jgi:hypothetical protein